MTSFKKYTVYIRPDQHEFLKTQGNISNFIRDAIDDKMNAPKPGTITRADEVIRLSKLIEKINAEMVVLKTDSSYKRALDVLSSFERNPHQQLTDKQKQSYEIARRIRMVFDAKIDLLLKEKQKLQQKILEL